jgi:putative transposase
LPVNDREGYRHLADVPLDKILYSSEINSLRDFLSRHSAMNSSHVRPFAALGWRPRSSVSLSPDLLIENLALRRQLAASKRQCRRPRLAMLDKLFWVLLYRFWSSWKKALIVVSPDTVVRWHRAGFRLYWQLISRVSKLVGRKPMTKEIRELIFKMVAENPTWRAPRIHGELVMLGFEISERSLSR